MLKDLLEFINSSLFDLLLDSGAINYYSARDLKIFIEYMSERLKKKKGGVIKSELAQKYNLSFSTIENILHRKMVKLNTIIKNEELLKTE